MKFPIKLLTAAFAFAIATASQAQTTYTLGTGFCAPHSVNCSAIPLEGGGTVWIDLTSYIYPTSSRFITRIPELLADNGFAEVNLDSTYKVTMTAVTYTAANGITYSGSVPESITLTWVENDVMQFYPYAVYVPPTPYTGTATINLGNYYYAYTCSGRGCGGTLGWHWQVVGGTITVNPPSTAPAAVNYRFLYDTGVAADDDYSPKGQASEPIRPRAQSPNAPTPVCPYPPSQCPKDWPPKDTQ